MRAFVAEKLASIEILPYHSASFRDADHWIKHLPSVQLAKDYVRDILLPKVRAGEALLIATRQVRAWGVTSEPGVICYDGIQARGAFTTPASRAGYAILDFLRKRPHPTGQLA